MSKVIDNLEAHRQERNEEMELLRGQVDEMEELRRNNDLLETHCKTLNYQLEVEKNEARERYFDLFTCKHKKIYMNLALSMLTPTCPNKCQTLLPYFLLNEPVHLGGSLGCPLSDSITIDYRENTNKQLVQTSVR